MDPVRDLKQEAHRLVDRLPPDASWDDLMYEVYVRSHGRAEDQAN